MIEGLNFPKYLHGTPITMYKEHPYSIIEPKSGEHIAPKDQAAILSPRQISIIGALKRGFVKSSTYASLIKFLEDYRAQHPDDIGENLHHLIEDEDGNFSVGLRVNILGAPTDFEIILATVFLVVFNPEKFEQVYLEDEIGEINDYVAMCSLATNTMAVLASNADLNNPMVIKAIELQLKVHELINDYRWSGIKCELLAGIPAIIVMRRWGIVDSTSVVEHGINENVLFSDIVEKINQGK